MIKNNLLKQLAGINLAKVKPKLDKVGANETAVGTMSDDLKRLFHLRAQAIDELNAAEKTIAAEKKAHIDLHLSGGIHSHDECVAHNEKMEKKCKEIDLLSKEVAALSGIFSNWAKLEFPELHNKNGIGICEDYTLVWFEVEQKPNPEISDILDKMLGIEILFGGASPFFRRPR
ncbi:MAG: hypothetical protein WCF92_03135 [bacterium]